MMNRNHSTHNGAGLPPDRLTSLDGAAEAELDLSAEVSPEDLLDPAVLGALANAFYTDGLPALDGSIPSPLAPLPNGERGESNLSPPTPLAVGEVAATAEASVPALAWDFAVPEHHSLAGTAQLALVADEEHEHLALLEGLRESPPRPAPPADAGFYFLPPGPREARSAARPTAFPVETIRQDFPILHQRVHGKPLIWMDNAATTQKPRCVIKAVTHFYEHDNSNTHRAQHTLSVRATNLYEGARERVRRFVGAAQPEEIVFTRGATEAINLVAQSYGKQHLRAGDEIVVSTIEHHANIVPWQHLVQETGAVLRVIPVNDRGEVLLEEYEKLLGPRTRLVALTHASNAIGTILPVAVMTRLAHRHGARVLIDGAQAVPHFPVSVQALGCDFYAFAGHKLFGPTGVGVLYGKRALLDAMPPWQGGGGMMEEVTFEHTTYRRAPARFEAGTGSLASVVGLGAAIDYLEDLGMDDIRRYEQELLVYATAALGGIPGLRLVGTAAEKVGVLSFVLDGVPPEDLGRFLDQEGIAVRVGRHCAHPAMKHFGVTATVRPSLAFYNTHAEVDALVTAIHRAKGGT